MGRYRKDVGEVIKYAENRGFTCVGMTGSGHWRLRHTGGRTVIISATPTSRSRWRKNSINHIDRICADPKEQP